MMLQENLSRIVSPLRKKTELSSQMIPQNLNKLQLGLQFTTVTPELSTECNTGCPETTRTKLNDFRNVFLDVRRFESTMNNIQKEHAK